MHNNTVDFAVDKNGFVDDGEGVITFPNGLPITDNSEQRNGTQYDIESMDLSEYKGQMTADHTDRLDHIIADVSGVRKAGNQVVVDRIKYLVKENPYARMAYNLIVGRGKSDFSIETYGPPADDSGVYRDAKLIGLSQVVVGNNRNASINKIAYNSIAQSKQDGLDTHDLETLFKENDMSEEKTETVVDTKVEASADTKVETPAIDINALTESITKAMDDKFSALTEKVSELEQNAFDKKAEEPKFVVNKSAKAGASTSPYKGMDYKERHAKQINAAWDLLKRGDVSASKELNDINEYNLAELKSEGVVSNTLKISDFGNFVISRELLTDIEGVRNDFSALLGATEWKETLSTQMAWLVRNGDIDMQNVTMCDDGSNGNLKPIKEYSADIKTADLEELAAVTPVCNAATRFLAVDLLSDVAQGYRTDYDRKRAQLVIARLQQATNNTGKVKNYQVSQPTDVWFANWADVASVSQNGTFIFNSDTYAELMKSATSKGISGPLSSLLFSGAVPTILGRPFIVVPNELMPSVNTGGTKTVTVNGSSVTINRAVFYADLSTFTGRTSGGLQYDLSTEAAYEQGGVVKSAYQRNELVLRGSFFRGGAVRNEQKVSAINAVAVS